MQPLNLRRSALVLDLGCGTGLHAFLLSTLGLRAIGVDKSHEAIAHAQQHFHRVRYINIDGVDFLRSRTEDTFDMIYCRGLSWFHYELEGEFNRHNVNTREAGKLIMSRVKTGGFWVLQMATDFSGTWHDTGIRNHTHAQVLRFASRFGTLYSVTDWAGTALASHADAIQSRKNVIAVVRKTKDPDKRGW